MATTAGLYEHNYGGDEDLKFAFGKSNNSDVVRIFELTSIKNLINAQYGVLKFVEKQLLEQQRTLLILEH